MSPSHSFQDGNYQPMQGITTHALIQTAGLEFDHGIVDTISLLDIRGTVIGEYSLSAISEELLLAEPFRPPDVSEYYMVIKGTINGGETFIRQSHNAIINLVPEPPTVKMVTAMRGNLHSKASILCSVKSMTPFKVVWYKGDQRDGVNWEALTVAKLLSGKERVSDVTYEIEDVTDHSEGYYKCVIQTSRGIAEGVTFLDVEVTCYNHFHLNIYYNRNNHQS